MPGYKTLIGEDTCAFLTTNCMNERLSFLWQFYLFYHLFCITYMHVTSRIFEIYRAISKIVLKSTWLNPKTCLAIYEPFRLLQCPVVRLWSVAPRGRRWNDLEGSSRTWIQGRSYRRPCPCPERLDKCILMFLFFFCVSVWFFAGYKCIFRLPHQYVSIKTRKNS